VVTQGDAAEETPGWEIRIREWCAATGLPDRAEDLLLIIQRIALTAEPTAWLQLWEQVVAEAREVTVNHTQRDQNIDGGQHNAARDQTIIRRDGHFYYNQTIIVCDCPSHPRLPPRDEAR
jgi:hypothetical protein